MARLLIAALFYLVIAVSVSGQTPDDVKKIVPAAPTTAALGKYGQVPVSMNTGIPNISVPLFTIQAKEISVPIDLSYHAGGVKVEEMASWVGLGWSLNAGGVITRQVRGLPDEDSYGYMVNSVNVDALITGKLSSPSQYMEQVDYALRGLTDLEPDIFYYNFNGQSGKFIYKKAENRFETIPYTRLQISYGSFGWKIVTAEGTVHYFDKLERNSTSSICNNNSSYSSSTITTGWYLSKIVNSTQTDSVSFNYSAVSYGYNTLHSSDRYFVADVGNSACSSELVAGSNSRGCQTANDMATQRLSSIVYRGGSITFIPQSSSRCDLFGDKALQSISVRAPDNQELFNYSLIYDYFSRSTISPCGAGASPLDFRLQLVGVTKASGTQSEIYRSFEYNQSTMPQRLSYAQDYWGFYNGQDANYELNPTVVLLTNNGPMELPGANRVPVSFTNTIQIGMLTGITYPTGGKTEFEYENNRIAGSFMPEFREVINYLDITNGSSGLYQRTINIDVAPSAANGFAPQGGAFVDFVIEGITCSYGPEATNNCAIISITGPQGFTITENISGRYMPNGVYTLKADFTNNANSATWEDFVVRMTWSEVDGATIENSIFGGLRIKRIKDHDGLGNVVYDRSYVYLEQYDSNVSSGRLDLPPSFIRKVQTKTVEPCPLSLCTLIQYCNRWLISASTNYPVAGMGYGVNYSFVTELLGPDGQFGKSTYKYSTSQDVLKPPLFPFAPMRDTDWRKGQLLEKTDYVKKTGGQYQVVKKTKNIYRELRFGTAYRGIRAGLSQNVINTSNYIVDPVASAVQDGQLAVVDYEIVNSFAYPDSVITYSYDSDGQQAQTVWQRNRYDSYTLNQISTSSLGVGSEVLTTWMKYPENYQISFVPGLDEQSKAIALLKQKNVVSIPIEKTIWRKRSSVDSVLIGASLNFFKADANDKVFPKKSMSFPVGSLYTSSSYASNTFSFDSDYQTEMEVISYDSRGNILEAIGRDGIKVAFTWDPYNNVTSVTKGAGATAVFYEGFENASAYTSTTAKAGAKSLTTSYTVTLPSVGTYKLSYYKKVGTGPWELITQTISSSIVIGGSGILIDEVRLYPPGAQMTAYSHKPGVGIISTTDQNSQVNYYSYDEMNRLKVVKDDKGNIIKSMNYHYMTQN